MKTLATYLDLHHTFQAGRADTLVDVADIEPSPGGADPAGAGLDADRRSTASQHFNFATEQLQSFPSIGQLTAAEAGLGIKLKTDTLGQFHPALFANLGDVVGSESGNPTRHRGPDQQKRSEEHTSELQSLMRNSYAVLCLKKNTKTHTPS